jgi:transglutaminase-like putative cysteine protease
MSRRSWIVFIVTLLAGAGLACAQFKEATVDGQKTGDTKVTRWRAGMIVKATGGPCQGMFGYAPVPTDWPEQQVTTVSEEISPEAKVKYEMVDGGVRIMRVEIAKLAANEEAKAIITVEIRRSEIVAPDETDIYVLPDPKKLPPEIRPYLLPSPKIESRDPKIRDLAKTVGADKEKAWEKVEAIYDFVREKIKYENGPLKGALAALKDGTGDCEEITSLFIAICRAADIPARTVWVPRHCYPEFYLEDDKGQGHWFPCQSAGARQFGGISETRPILQKGDNFRPPRGNSKERQRYMAEYLIGKPSPGGGKPQVTWVRDPVAN